MGYVLKDLKQPGFSMPIPDGINPYWWMNNHSRALKEAGLETAAYMVYEHESKPFGVDETLLDRMSDRAKELYGGLGT